MKTQLQESCGLIVTLAAVSEKSVLVFSRKHLFFAQLLYGSFMCTFARSLCVFTGVGNRGMIRLRNKRALQSQAEL